MEPAAKPRRRATVAQRQLTLQALVGRFVHEPDFAADLHAAATTRKGLDQFLFKNGFGDISANVKTYLASGRTLEQVRDDVSAHMNNQPVSKLY